MIIGSGPAGYTAAIYAARAMLKPLLLSGFEPGGQLMITTDVENYPGFATPIQGPWLMEQLRAQAEHVGARIESEYVTRSNSASARFAFAATAAARHRRTRSFWRPGAKAKWLELPSEQAFKGFGVSACATCDGFFFRGKKVLVVGGGNSAVEEALYLSNLARMSPSSIAAIRFAPKKSCSERLFRRGRMSRCAGTARSKRSSAAASRAASPT